MTRSRLPVITDAEILQLLYEKGPNGPSGSDIVKLVPNRCYKVGQLTRLCESGKLCWNPDTFAYRLSFSTWVELTAQAARVEASSCSGKT